MKDVLLTIPLERPEPLPHTLCIDEFKGDSGIWDPGSKHWVREKFQVGIADAASGTIVNILPDVRAFDIKAYFFQYSLHERKRVEYFCCDMHNGYTSVAKACFPDAVICIDLFHVIKRLNDAIDEIRRRLQNDARDNDQPELYEMLRHASKALLTKESNQKKLWRDSYDHNIPTNSFLNTGHSNSPKIIRNRRKKMTADKNFINHCIFDLGIDAPDNLIHWFLAYYSDEPREGFYSEEYLTDLLRRFTDAYWQNGFDTAIPSRYRLLKQRLDDYKDINGEISADNAYLKKQNLMYKAILREHNLL